MKKMGSSMSEKADIFLSLRQKCHCAERERHLQSSSSTGFGLERHTEAAPQRQPWKMRSAYTLEGKKANRALTCRGAEQ